MNKAGSRALWTGLPILRAQELLAPAVTWGNPKLCGEAWSICSFVHSIIHKCLARGSGKLRESLSELLWEQGVQGDSSWVGDELCPGSEVEPQQGPLKLQQPLRQAQEGEEAAGGGQRVRLHLGWVALSWLARALLSWPLCWLLGCGVEPASPLPMCEDPGCQGSGWAPGSGLVCRRPSKAGQSRAGPGPVIAQPGVLRSAGSRPGHFGLISAWELWRGSQAGR